MLPPAPTSEPGTLVAPDGRRLRLSPDLAWLLGEVEAGATVGSLAEALSRRTGRPVSEADARDLVVRTLVAHGLAKLHRNGRVSRVTAAPAPRPDATGVHVFATVLPAPLVTRVARSLRALGSPVAVAAAGAAGLAVGGAALLEARAWEPGAWTDPRAWLLALFAWAVALLVHEFGHAFTFARAGGEPGPIGLARMGGMYAWSCTVDGAGRLPARSRALLALAGPAWQLGAGAALLLFARAMHVPTGAPVAALLVLQPLLNLLPLRHADGDRLAAVLAGADDGAGLVWQPPLAPGRSAAPLRAHGLLMALYTGALAAWFGGVLAPAAFGAPPAGAAVRAVGVGAALVALLGAWTAGSLVARAFRWSASDLTRRRPTPVSRYLRNAWARLKVTAPVRLGHPEAQNAVQLVPVMLSLSFPDRSAAALRRAAQRHIEEVIVTRLDHEEMAGRGMPDEIRHGQSVQALLAAKQGAIVCSMHLGPFHYVSLALLEMGAPLAVFAAGSVRQMWIDRWESKVRTVGGSFEALEAGTPRGALRAMRALEEGRFLVVYMDGQEGAAQARETRRADFRFCGAEIFMRTGPAFLAQRAGVPMLLGACYREGPARRIVEFSDPFPPPVSGDEDALVDRTGELYGWFEPRVRRHAEQWPGWLYPIMHWRRSGDSPTATREAFEAAIARASGLLAEGASTRLVADATRVGWMSAGDEVLIVHGPTHRVMAGSPLARALLTAAHRRARVRDLPRATGAPPEVLAAEIARFVLAGIAELRD